MSRIILPSIRNSKSLTLFTSCLLMVALWLPFSASAQTCIGPLVVPITGAGTGSALGITSLQATGVPTSCGASNGSISVTISGGTAPYTYVISTSASAPCTTPLSGYAGATFNGSSTTHLFSTLPAGSYYFCITDANGCSVRSTIPFTIPNTGIQISSTAVVNASCGTANGSATVYATGGTAYTYAWTGGQTSQTATGLTAGIYTVTVTATGGCTATAQVAITNVGGPVVTAAVTPASCPSSNGSADITITGGTAPYTIVWTGSGSGTDPRTGLAPGSYGVQVTDATGCVGTLVVAVGTSSPITASVVSNSPSCGQSNGTATVSAANGTAPYTYTWNTGATGASQTNLAAGTYSVTITDANSCTTVYQFTLNNSSQTATLTISGTTNVTCPGLSNGSVTASVSGGGTFTVTNAAGVTFPANALPAGTYTVTAFTSGGCVVSSQQITITQPANIQASLNFVPTACNGTAPSSATVTFTGGTAPYTVAWSDGSTANPRTAIPQGTYTITVTDSRGCPYTFPFTVGPPPCPLNSFADVCAIVNPNGTVQICASPQLGYQNENFTVLQGPQLLGDPSGAPGVLVNPATGQACFTYNATDISPTAYALVNREEVMTIRACNPVLPTQCDDFTIRVLVNDPPTVALPGQIAADNILETTRRIRPGDALTVCTYVLNVDQYCSTNLADVPQQPNQIGPLLPGATATWVSDATIPSSLPPPNQGAYAPLGDNQWCVVYNSPYAPGATDTIQTIFCDPAPYGLCDTFRLIIQIYDVPDIVSLAGSGSYVNDVATVTVNPNSSTTNCMGFDPYHRNETMTIIDAPNLAGATASLGAQPLDTCVTYNAPNMPGSTDFILVTACNPAAPTLCDTLRINYIIACPITTLAGTVVSDATSCIGSGSACLPITQTQLTQWNGTILVDGSTYSGAVTSCNGGAGVSIVLTQGTHTVQVNYGVGCSAATTVTVAGPPPLTFVGVTSTNTTQCGVNDGTLTIELDNPGIAPFTVTSNGQPLTGGVLSGNNLTFSNLAAGTYGPFNITNGLGCNVTSTATTTITAPTSPTITSATFTNPTACIAPNNTGTLNIVMGVAGTAPYTWTLNGNSVTPTGAFPNFTIAGLALGSYAGQNLVVTAANGCTATFALTGSITAPAAPVVTSVTPTNATCGQTNGTLTINMSTAATNYTYVWNPSTGTPNAAGNARTGLAAGTYTITITTTATGCTATTTGSVNSTGGATVTAGTITPATCLAANGSVVINVTGGTAPYTITRSGSASSQNLAAAGNITITGLAASVTPYIITVTDANGCISTVNVTITSTNGTLTATATQTTQAVCLSPNGSATANPSAGTAPYTYAWGNSQTTQTATGLVTGSYPVTVTDANGCTVSATAVVTASPGTLAVTAAQTQQASCGVSNGTATATATGGTTPYTYAWSGTPTQTTPVVTGLGAGVRTVTVTDANGCSATATVTITQQAAPAAATFTVTQPLCAGQTGSITVTNPVAGVTYSINGVNGTVFTGLAAGSYTIVATLSSCTTNTSPITINAAPSTLAITMSQTAAACTNTGTATATVTGGTTAYTYAWSGITQTTATATGLDNGAISVTVTDANGCTVTGTTTVADACIPCNLAATATSTAASCGSANGTATASFTDTGNNTPYTYAWSTTPPQTFATATGLVAGAYTVTISNGIAGCTATATTTVSNLGAPTVVVSGQTNTTCGLSNGSYTVNVTVGTAPITISINGGTATAITLNTPVTFNNLASGTYNITVLDANNCAANSTVTIGASTPLAITATGVNPTTCAGTNGTATVTTAGLTYAWSTTPQQTTQTATGLAAGIYSVTATSAAGCTATATVTLVNPTAPAVATFTVTQPVCGGQTGTITVTNPVAGVTYSINGVNGTVFTGLAAGSYTIVATLNACTSSTAAITINAAPSALAITMAQTPASCVNDGTATATVSGGTATYNYAWSTTPVQTTATATGLDNGAIVVTVTDANGCTITGTTTVVDACIPCALAVTTTSTNASCGQANGTATANFTDSGSFGPYNFTWSTTPAQFNATATGLTAGVYTVIVTNSLGCTAGTSAAVSNVGAPTVAVSGQTNTTCGASNGAYTVTVTSGTAPITISINAGTATAITLNTPLTFNNLASGTYNITVLDANSCATNNTVTIGASTPLAITATGVNPTTCAGIDGTATVTTAGLTYAWSANAANQTTQTATGLAAGTYTVTATDATGCTATATVTLLDPNAPAVATFTVTQPACGGQTGTITVTNPVAGVTYSINGVNGTVFTGLAAGSYTIVATLNACTSSTAAITINAAPSVLAITMAQTPASCVNDGTATATVSGGATPYTYVWTGGQTTATATGLDNGAIVVTVTDANSCTATATISVGDNCTPPSCNLVVTTITANDASCGQANGSATVNYTGGTAPVTFEWNTSPPQFNQTATGLVAGVYTVVLTDAAGCTAAGSTAISNIGAPTVTTSNLQDASCGLSNGAVTVTGSAGTVTIQLDSNTPVSASTTTFTGIAAGTHTITVTNASGCQTIRNITINSSSVLAITSTAVNPTACGTATGSATVTTSGLSYIWSTSPLQQTTQTANNLAAGTYTVTATNAQGCTASTTVSLNDPNAPAVPTLTVAQATCSGGTGTITVNNPVAGVTYTLLPSATVGTTFTVAAGTYTVQAELAGCTSNSASATINTIPTLTLNASASCVGSNATVTANATGGTGASYTFSFPGQLNQTGTSVTFNNNLSTGAQTVTVTDANGCTATATVTVPNNCAPPPACNLSISSITSVNANCGQADGTATVNFTETPLGSNYTFTWNPANSGQTINNVAAGTYTVTVTNTTSGCSAVSSTVISNNGAPTITITNQTAASCGASNGAFTATGSAGTVSVQLNNNTPVAGTTATFTGLTAGNYTVTVLDANGCLTNQIVTIGATSALTVTTSRVNPTTCSGTNGSATVNTSGLTYLWSNGQTTQTATGLADGTYIVTVTDASGCTATASAVLNDPTAPTAPIGVISQAIACGGGSATITVSNPVANTTYTLLPNNVTGTTYASIGVGTYTIRATNNISGCSSNSAIITVTSPSALVINLGQTAASCINDGTATAIVSGGAAPYTYVWTGGQASATATGLDNGAISVTVTDNSGCTASATISVDDNCSPPTCNLVISSVAATNASCGQANGSATVNYTGGTAPISIEWGTTPIQTGQTATGLLAGIYTVIVTDATGCTAAANAVISNAGAPTVTVSNTQNASCGLANGSTTITVNSGVAPLTLVVDGGAPQAITVGAAQLVSNLSAGTHNITITDANGCQTNRVITIGANSVLSITATGTNPSACAAADGTATVTTAGLNYQWSTTPQQTTQTATGLTAGTYTVVATDGNGCTASATVTLNDPNAPATPTLTAVQPTCAGGTGTITVNSPVAGVTYTLLPTGTTGTTFTVGAGTYTVQAALAGCVSNSGAVTITTPATLNLNVSQICQGATATVTASANGGTGTSYTYTSPFAGQTSNTTGVFNSISAGTYTITVTDANACTTSAPVVVQSCATPPTCALTIANISTVQATCGTSDGTATVNFTDDAGTTQTISWSNSFNTASITGLAAGSYTVTVTNNLGCSATATTTISNNGAPTATISNIVAATCGNNNGAFTVTGGAGTASIQLGTATPIAATTNTFTNLAAGTYTVTIIDVNGCQTVTTVTIGATSTLTITATGVNPTTCGGSNGTATVTTAGLTYLWSNGQSTQTATGLTAGTYTVVATDVNGCTASATVTLNDPGAPATPTATVTQPLCAGGTGSIVVNNPVANVTYTLLPNATVGTTFNNLTAGTYTVQASLAACVSNSASIVITNPSTLTLNLASVCQGSTATVTATATGGASSYLYTFNGNAPTATNTFAGVAQGTYTVSVADANACSTSASIAVQDCTPACNLVITSVAVTDASCGQANGSATVNYTGGTAPVTFEWNTAPVAQFNQTATGLLAGVYTVTITDANGCTAAANAVVSNVGAPVASISSVQDATCGLSNGAFTVTITSGAAPLTISLDGGAAQAIALNTPRVFNNLTAATHTITITDANGCITNRNITIGSGSALTLSISTTAPTSCSANDGTATVSPAGLTYSWSTGSTNQTITGLSGGIVTVTATNAQGCSATASATLNPVGGPTTPVLSVAQPSCAGGTGTITVSNAVGGVVYTLNGGAPATTFTGLADGTYTVVATLNGCTSSATATVIVPSQIALNVSAACNNNLGEATATASGGTGLYTFTLGAQTVNGTSASFTPLAQGTYTISVSDANGCATSAPVTVPNCVTVPVCNLTIANVATVQATCGSNNGSAAVTISDPGAAANTTYNYTWNPSISTTASATGLTAGAYNVTVSSSTGCTASATANISNSGGPVVTISNTQNAACGSADGSFSVTVVSGSPTFTVAVNGQPTQNNIATGSTVNFANLAANTYTVTVTDLNGCVTINTVDITTTPSFTVTATGNNPTTCGGTNGTATVTAGSTYLWSNSLTTQSINTLSAGIYDVTVTNAAGCTATASVTLQDPGAPSVSGTVTQAITCAGGTGAISVSNPQVGVVYTLYNGNTALSSFTGLAAGTYTIQAALGTCVGVSASITITAPVTLELNLAATDQTCSPDGAINASASGGTAPYTYTGAGLTTQTGSSVIFNNLAQGNYTVTVTDANGCSTSALITVGITCPNSPTCNLIVSSITGTDATCGSANGTATVNFTESPLGTYTFVWSPSVGTTASVTGLTAGVAYNVTVTSISTGCTASAVNPIVLSNAGGPAVDISNIQDATCTAQNGSFNVTVTAGTSNFSVEIDGIVQTTSLPLNTAFVANNLLAGAHTVVVTDANGCITSRTVTVGQSNANITVTAVQTQAASCGGGTNGMATASANGGTAPYTYIWSNQTGSVATGLAAGSYTVTVVDANGCSASTSVSISELNAPAVPTLTVTQPICSGQTGSIAVQSPVAGVTYTLYAGTVAVGSATSFTGLVANVNYTVEAVNASGCTAVSNVVTINTPSTFTLSIGTTAASCTNDGTATLTVNGGTAPYSYAWSTSVSATNTAIGLDNGAISATVTDANGCSVAISGTVADNCVIADCSGFVISNVATVQATCGTSNGSATVNFTDPNASAGTTYTYVWSVSANGQNTASVINLPAGVISVTVSSSTGCTATYTTGISNVAGPSATVSNIVNATCTAADGAVTISTNALTPFTIVFNGATSTTTPATFTGLAAGTYTAVITDVNGCIATRTITIGSNNASFTVTATGVNPTTCGGTNGTATVTAGASYLWSTTPAAATQSINGLVAGLYTVTVTNASGCTSSASVTLQDGGTTVPTATVANVACYGGTNGVITVIAPSAGTTYTLYDANNQAVGAAGTSFTGLAAGTYTVHAVNAAGCTSVSTSLTVTQPATLVLNVLVNNSYCNDNTGSIVTTVTGGTSAYNYNWSGGATTAGLSGLATGTTENLTVTDANGCTVSALNLVVGNDCPPACDLSFTGVTVINTACGNNNGSITVTATSTAGNFTYSWTAPNGTVFQTTTNTATGLVAGTYTFTITDANGCQIDSTVAINNTNGPSLTVSGITPANCTAADGSFTLAITGGVAPYNVTWNGGNTTINTNAATVIGSLAAGNYTVGVTDANGCFNSQIVTIGANSALAATVGTLVEPTCTQANGAIPFTVNGGTAPYNYSLDGTVIFNGSVQTTETFTGLAAGTYNICVSDANGCQVCQTVVLNNAGATAVNIADFTLAQPSCPQQNGSLTGGPGGSSTYEVWQGATLVGAVPQTNLVAGTYELRATDINGCQSSVLFTITAKPDWNVVLSPSNETCANNDGSISVSVSGATPNYTFAWSNSGTTNPLTGLSQGTYEVTITDGLACTTTASVVIDSICATPCNLQITGVIVNNATCGQADGGIQLQVTGGTPNFTYTWSPNISTTADANNLTAGVYSVTVVDAVGCSDIASNIVVANTSGAVISATASTATCTAANGSVTITAVSGTAPFTAQLVGVAGTQTIAAVAGTTTFTGLAAGTYAFLVTDANGCASTTTQTVQSSNSGITVNTTIITAPSCNAADGVVNLAATNGTAPYIYTFDGVATGENVTGVQAGVYTVVATDANGCVATTTVTVSDANGPTLTASNFTVTDITCPNAVNGSIAVANGQAGVTYTIALGNTIASFPQTNLPEGCYTVYAAENGCVSALQICIGAPADWDITVSATAQSCTNSGNIDLTVAGASGPYTYSWNTVPSLNTQDVSVDEGTYMVTINDSNGCSTTAMAMVGNDCVPLPPVAVDDSTSTNDITPINIVVTQNDTLRGADTIYIVSQPQVGTVALVNDSTIVYTPVEDSCGVTYSFQYAICNAVGCDTATVYVEILCPVITVYNGFSPNGDNYNEVFTIHDIERFPNNEILIYNRWGNLVYKTTGYTNDNGWKGTFDGKDLPDGTYFYILKLNDNRYPAPINGYIELHR